VAPVYSFRCGTAAGSTASDLYWLGVLISATRRQTLTITVPTKNTVPRLSMSTQTLVQRKMSLKEFERAS